MLSAMEASLYNNERVNDDFYPLQRLNEKSETGDSLSLGPATGPRKHGRLAESEHRPVVRRVRSSLFHRVR